MVAMTVSLFEYDGQMVEVLIFFTGHIFTREVGSLQMHHAKVPKCQLATVFQRMSQLRRRELVGND